MAAVTAAGCGARGGPSTGLIKVTRDEPRGVHPNGARWRVQLVGATGFSATTGGAAEMTIRVPTGEFVDAIGMTHDLGDTTIVSYVRVCVDSHCSAVGPPAGRCSAKVRAQTGHTLDVVVHIRRNRRCRIEVR